MAKTFGLGPGAAGLAGGMTGGIVQAYATMGFCTCMKTAEITRVKQMQAGEKPKSTWALLKPHFETLISRFAFPHLSFTEAKQEIWNVDPVEFIRTSIGMSSLC